MVIEESYHRLPQKIFIIAEIDLDCTEICIFGGMEKNEELIYLWKNHHFFIG